MYVSEYQCPAPVICGALGWGKLFLGLNNGVLVVFNLQVGTQCYGLPKINPDRRVLILIQLITCTLYTQNYIHTLHTFNYILICMHMHIILS